MIVAYGKSDDGERLLVVGLTRENIVELQKGHPIRVNRGVHGDAVPQGLTIGIVYGDNKADLLRLLTPFMDADTDIIHGPDT